MCFDFDFDPDPDFDFDWKGWKRLFAFIHDPQDRRYTGHFCGGMDASWRLKLVNVNVYESVNEHPAVASTARSSTFSAKRFTFSFTNPGCEYKSVLEFVALLEFSVYPC